jgi:hypothetical protein
MQGTTLYLLFLYALNGAVLMFGFFLSFRRRRVYSVLYGGLAAFLAMGVVAGAGLKDFDASSLAEGQLLMFLSNFLLLFTCEAIDGVWLSGGDVHTRSAGAIIGVGVERYYWAAFGMFTVMFLLVLSGGGLSRLELNWSEARSATGYLEVPANLMAFGAFPAVWMALRQRHFGWVITFGVLAFVFFETSGSRALLISIGGAAFLDLMTSRSRLRKRIGVLILLSFLSLAAHTTARWMRGFGPAFMYNELFSGHLMEDLGSNVQIDYTGGEAGPLGSYYYALHMNPNEPPYGRATTWVRVALLYVPKEIFPEKPLDLTYQVWADQLVSGYMNADPMVEILAEKLSRGEPGSDHMLLWGDGFLNFGFLGFVIYPVAIGIFAVFLERAIGRLSRLGLITIGPIAVLFYVWLARGNVVIGFGYLAYIVPFMLLLSITCRLPVFANRRAHVSRLSVFRDDAVPS